MKETVLLYRFEDKLKRQQLIKAFLCMGIKVIEIKREDYLKPVGNLTGSKEIEGHYDLYTGEEIGDEMLVFVGISGNRLDDILNFFRKNKIKRVNYKAILTETNMNWNSLQLYEELKKEHEAMKQP